MVVTLGTLQIHPEEHARRVSRKQVRLGRTVHHELHGRPQGRIDAVGRQNLTGQLVVRLVRHERRLQVLLPLDHRHMSGGPSLHEHHVKHVGHVYRKTRAGQEAIDEQLPLVRSRIVEKGSRFNGRWQIASQIECDATEEVGVARQRSDRADLTRFDQLVDARSQRFGGKDGNRSAGHDSKRDQDEPASGQAGCHGGFLGGLGGFK